MSIRIWSVRGGALIWGTAFCCMIGASIARGSVIVPSDQIREVEAIAEITGEGSDFDSDFQSAPDFGPFNALVDAGVSMGPPGNSVSSGSMAQQDSSISATVLDAIGRGEAASSPWQANLFSTASGRSYFGVTFDLTKPTPYVLTGSVDAGSSNGGEGLGLVAIRDLNGVLFQVDTTAGFLPVNSAGLLDPGTYTVEALGQGIAGGSNQTAFGAYNLNFTLVPEPVGAAGLLLAGVICAAARRRGR